MIHKITESDLVLHAPVICTVPDRYGIYGVGEFLTITRIDDKRIELRSDHDGTVCDWWRDLMFTTPSANYPVLIAYNKLSRIEQFIHHLTGNFM